MKRKKRIIGEDFVPQVQKKTPDLRSTTASHGDVFQGGLADEALNAVGARAMTMDGEIIVNSNFDLSSAEDQALYAHELYHKKHSGGVAGSTVRDAEEIAARAIEAMVFHKATGGRADALPTNADDLFAQAENIIPPSEGQAQNKGDTKRGSSFQKAPTAIDGYKALLQQGKPHAEIVQMLVDILMDNYDTKHQDEVSRGGASKGFGQ